MAATVIAKRGAADGGVVRAGIAGKRTGPMAVLKLPFKPLLTVKSAPAPTAVLT
jgi:hypothetical protein